MIKVTEEFLYKEHLNYVGLSITKPDDYKYEWQRLDGKRLVIVSLNTDCKIIKWKK